MSRSYKKTPRAGDKKNKFFKKYSNHRIRHRSVEDHDLNYGAYKKASCSWNICDFETVGITFEQYWRSVLRSWHRFGKGVGMPYPNRDEEYREYRRWYIRK